MKDEFGGVIVSAFVGLKSKMYSIKKIDGKEHNAAKGVSIATEFDKFKDVLFNKKLLDTKWRESKVKNIKWEHMKLTKYLYHVLTIKDIYQMMEFILSVIFTKIVSQIVIIKKIVIIEKDWDYWKRLWLLKKLW